MNDGARTETGPPSAESGPSCATNISSASIAVVIRLEWAFGGNANIGGLLLGQARPPVRIRENGGGPIADFAYDAAGRSAYGYFAESLKAEAGGPLAVGPAPSYSFGAVRHGRQRRGKRLNPGHVFASFAYADPAGSGAIAAAVLWLGGTLLGTVATTVAVISVAAVGLMMLSGRTDLRRGAGVILGCFVLFGASAIAAGIEATMRGDSVPPLAPVAYQPPPPSPAFQPLPAQRPAPADPYAGAAVPTR